MSGTGSLILQDIDPSFPVGTRVYGSPLLDTCYETISVSDGSGGWNINLYKWTLGTIGSSLASAASGVATGANYTLDVRWAGGKISAYINGGSTALWTYDASADPDTARFTAMGFGSSTDGARVGGATVYTLTQTFAALADVAWWVVNGNLYASDSGPSGGRLIGAFFDPAAVVSGQQCEWHQTATLVDGTHCVKFDAAAMTAAPKVIAAGSMPGQSALNTPPGVTTAKFVINYNDRGGGLFQEQYAIFPAIGTDDDYDLTVDTIGKAFVWPSQVGEPLLGAFVAAKNRLIMGGRRSLWELTGDPVLGADITRISAKTGISGPGSMCMVEEGTVLFHSDQGAGIIPSGGNPTNLSETVLTDVITGQTADTHFVSVVQDTESFGIWIFLTPQDGSVGRHIFYDERTGRFIPSPDPLSQLGGGGWWPITFGSAGVQPTCAMRYQGKVVFGTMDGRMMTFDKAVAGNDGGAPFSSKLMLQSAHPDDIADQSIALREVALVMGLGSDPVTLTLFGGDTPERAFDPAGAWMLWQGTMNRPRNSFPVSVTAPSIVLQLSATGTAWALEACQIDFGIEPITLPPRRAPLAPVAVCAPPATSSGGGGAGPGGGPGTGSGGSGGGAPAVHCPVWMGHNTTDDVGGVHAYKLVSNLSLDAIPTPLEAALKLLEGQGIIGMNASIGEIYVYLAVNKTGTGGGGYFSTPFKYKDFAATFLPPGAQWAGYTFDVFFRCADQSPPLT
jgi:hypothetical protein